MCNDTVMRAATCVERCIIAHSTTHSAPHLFQSCISDVSAVLQVQLLKVPQPREPRQTTITHLHRIHATNNMKGEGLSDRRSVFSSGLNQLPNLPGWLQKGTHPQQPS